ncbi:MAG: hypothetical protein IPG51_12985 [Chloroflexi bacterium]|nr:hypothetical protein [Chloroflexota bacterium]
MRTWKKILTSTKDPDFLRRPARSIYRILRAFVITMLVLAVLVGVAWGSLWLYETIRGEINRSTESVTTRFLAQESRIDILRREVDTLLGANRGQEEQINTLQTQLTEKTRQLDALTQDYNQQARLLEALDASMVKTLANDETAVQNITTSAKVWPALQTDFNTSTGRWMRLGGELDALNTTTKPHPDGLRRSISGRRYGRFASRANAPHAGRRQLARQPGAGRRRPGNCLG